VDNRAVKQIPPVVLIDGMPKALTECSFDVVAHWLLFHNIELGEYKGWFYKETLGRLTPMNYRAVSFALATGALWANDAYVEQTTKSWKAHCENKKRGRTEQIKHEKLRELKVKWLGDCVAVALEKQPVFANKNRLLEALTSKHIELLREYNLPTTARRLGELLTEYTKRSNMDFPTDGKITK
jgi:hypothetical protein